MQMGPGRGGGEGGGLRKIVSVKSGIDKRRSGSAEIKRTHKIHPSWNEWIEIERGKENENARKRGSANTRRSTSSISLLPLATLVEESSLRRTCATILEARKRCPRTCNVSWRLLRSELPLDRVTKALKKGRGRGAGRFRRSYWLCFFLTPSNIKVNIGGNNSSQPPPLPSLFVPAIRPRFDQPVE